MNKMIVAKPGFNALTEDNPDNLIFSSDYNTLKYHASGNQQISIVGDTTDKTTVVEVTHGLGYVPVFIVFVSKLEPGSIGTLYQVTPTEDSNFTRTVRVESWADENKLYLSLRNKSSFTYTVNYYYKIFKNNLNM